MKQGSKQNVLSAVLWVLLLAAEAAAAAVVWRLDMLPARYFALLVSALMMLLSVSGILMVLGRYATRAGAAARGIAYFLALVTLLGCAATVVVAGDVLGTIRKITGDSGSKVTMAVYVRMDDPAQSLSDAADYTFGIVDGLDAARTDQALAQMEKELEQSVATEHFGSMQSMADALYIGDVDAVLLNSSQTAMLEEIDGYADFSERTRLLWSAEIAQHTSGGQDPNAAPSDNEKITHEPFVVYISGSDTRSDMLTTSRNDVNILAIVNPTTRQVLLVNTPRDYYVPNPAGDGALDKLTHCGIYGVSCSMEALADLYDVEVPYYAQINFTGFETLIDAIGGVTVYSDYSFTACDRTWIEEGENTLSGSEALDFARERYSLPGGDNDRGRNQMKVIKAMIEKLSAGTILANYADILQSLEGMLAMNMTQTDISRLVKMQLDDMSGWNVQTYAVTGEGGSEYTYSIPGATAYVMYPDEGMVAYGTELIRRVMGGETLTDADTVYPG